MTHASLAFTHPSQIDAIIAAAHACRDMTLDEFNDLIGQNRIGYDVSEDKIVDLSILSRRLVDLHSLIYHFERMEKIGSVTRASHKHPTRITLSEKEMATFELVLEFATDYTNDTCLDRLYDQPDISYALKKNPDFRDRVYEEVMRAVRLAEIRGQVTVWAVGQ